MAQRFFTSILVCIEHPRDPRQPALQRAEQLARRTGARLALFHSAYNPYTVGPHFDQGSLARDIDKALADGRAALEKLAARLRKRGLKVSTATTWDYPAHEAIVRETLRQKPDLVVAASRRHALGARLFLTNTDWQLIRLCPAPLLFVKQAKAYGKARVLAAIDPLHSAGKPAQLDGRILKAAQAMAEAHDGRLDVVHAHRPLYNHVPDMYGVAAPLAVDPALEQQHLRNTRRAMERIVARFALPPRQLHLEKGSAEEVLPDMTRRLRTDVVVMGAVSRRGLGRLLIGNTAERTLDHLPCDVLVIKPTGFRTSVPRRAAAPGLALPPL